MKKILLKELYDEVLIIHTYIYTRKNGWVYIALIIDSHSKKIFNYACGVCMTAELAIKAIKNTCLNVKDIEGILLHSILD